MIEIIHSAQRNYTKANGAVYTLPHDAEEHERCGLNESQTYPLKLINYPPKIMPAKQPPPAHMG